MAKDMDDVFDHCTDHPSSQVLLYCDTCQSLICSRCISQTAVNQTSHHNHAYLDIADAFEIKQEKLQKAIEIFKADLQSRKEARQSCQYKLQKLKLELLHKKSKLSKKTCSIQQTLERNEKLCRHHLDSVLQPAIDRLDEQFRDVDYEVVSRGGMLDMAQAVQRMSVNQGVSFLKRASAICRDMDVDTIKETLIDTRLTESVHNDQGSRTCEEITKLRQICFGCQKEKRTLSAVFVFPKDVPALPKLLPGWCIVGCRSAHIAWKCSQVEPILHFRVSYRLVTWCRYALHREHSVGHRRGEHTLLHAKSTNYIRIRNNGRRRNQVTLRDLDPDSRYMFNVCAVNDLGDGGATTAFFHTRLWDDKCDQIWFSGSVISMLISCFYTISAAIGCASCLFVIIVLLLYSYENVLCDALSSNLGGVDGNSCWGKLSAQIANVSKQTGSNWIDWAYLW